MPSFAAPLKEFEGSNTLFEPCPGYHRYLSQTERLGDIVGGITLVHPSGNHIHIPMEFVIESLEHPEMLANGLYAAMRQAASKLGSLT